jgi:hypothetical protein
MSRILLAIRVAFFSFGATAPICDLAYLPGTPFHFGLIHLTHSVGLLGRVISSSQGPLPVHKHRRTHTQIINIHSLYGIRTNDPGFRASEDSTCLIPLGYRDRHKGPLLLINFAAFIRIRYVSLVQMISYCILFPPSSLCPYSRPCV